MDSTAAGERSATGRVRGTHVLGRVRAARIELSRREDHAGGAGAVRLRARLRFPAGRPAARTASSAVARSVPGHAGLMLRVRHVRPVRAALCARIRAEIEEGTYETLARLEAAAAAIAQELRALGEP